MEELLVFLFWLVILVIAYTYLLYPGLMWMLGEKPPALPPADPEQLPEVALLIQATKTAQLNLLHLTTLLQSDYPAEKLQVWVALPETADPRSVIPDDYRSAHPQLHVLPVPATARPAEVQQQLADASTAPILVFVHPGTTFKQHTLNRLVLPYRQPQVGGVQPRMLNIGTLVEQVLEEEIIYTRYDQRIQQGESRFGILVGAQPACYSIRREVYELAPPELENSGLYIYMRTLQKGHRLAFAYDAAYTAEVSGSLMEQFEERVRRSESNYRSLSYFTFFLNPLEGKLASLMFWSHKVLRWFTPHLLLLALLLHLVLAFGWDYGRVLLWVHLGIYALAALDLLLAELGQNLRPLRIIRHFMVVNAAQLMGFGRYIKGKRADKRELAING